MTVNTFSRKIFSQFLICVLIILFFFRCGNVLENRKLNQLNDKFLDQFYQYFPVKATLIGFHKYDDNLDDYSLASIKKIQLFFQDNSAKLAKINSLKLSTANKINYHILKTKISENEFEFQTWKKWQTEATFYSDILQNLIRGINLDIIDSTSSNVVTMFGRIQKIPNLLNQGRENLQGINLKNLEFAIEQVQHVENYLSSGFIDKIDISPSQKDSLGQILGTTLDSLQSFRNSLGMKKQASADVSLALIGEKYKDYLNSMRGTQIELDSLKQKLQTEINIYSEVMYQSVISYLSSNNKIRRVSDNKTLIDLMNDNIEKEALKKDEIIPFCTLTIEHLKRFIDEIWNLSLPLNYNVKLIWSNDELSHPLKLAYFESQGFLGASPHLFCMMNSIDSNQDWIRQLANLRKYNKSSLIATMMLEANLSHYQYWSNNRQQIPVLAQSFPNKFFLQGWPYFLAFKLLESGYRGYDAKLHYVVFKNYIKMLQIALIEIQFYRGKITLKQFEQQLIKSLLFNREEAQVALEQSMVNPGQALMVFWGVHQLNDLEKVYRESLGRNFDFNKFVEETLYYGPVSLLYLKQLAVEKFLSKKENN